KLAMFLAGDAVAETADALKDRKVQVILRPGFDLLLNTRDRFSAARMLQERGVDFVFSLSARPATPPAVLGAAAALNPDAEAAPTLTIDPDFPLFPVAMLVKAGVRRNVALEALTKKPALLLGL